MTTGHRLFCKQILIFQDYALSSYALTWALLMHEPPTRNRKQCRPESHICACLHLPEFAPAGAARCIQAVANGPSCMDRGVSSLLALSAPIKQAEPSPRVRRARTDPPYGAFTVGHFANHPTHALSCLHTSQAKIQAAQKEMQALGRPDGE